MTQRKPKPVVYSTVDTPDGLVVRVSTDPSVREGLVALAVSAWFLYQGLRAIRSLAARPGAPWDHPLDAIFAGLLVIAGLSSFVAFFWALGACETVLLTPTELVLSKVFLGVGPRRRYLLSELEDLRVVYHDETRVTKGALTFKRGRKQVYFGKRLSTEQAADIVRAFGARSEIAFGI